MKKPLMRPVRLCAIIVFAALLLSANLLSTQAQSQPLVELSDPSYVNHESKGAIEFWVDLSAPSAETITVDYSTVDGTATAASGDYVPLSGTFTFAPGETSKTFSVTLLDDALDEGSQTIKLALSGGTAADLAAPAIATITIQDNDP